MNFTYNNERKEWITAVKIKRPYWANRKLNMITVPSMPGAHLASVETDPLIIPIRLEIDGEDRDDYFVKTEELTSWFAVEKAAPLIFDDRPNRTYFAIVEGSLDPDEIVRVGYVDVSFICPDPYKYDEEREAHFPSDLVLLKNNGTADADPIFELTAKKATTFALIQNELDEYQMIGKPIESFEIPPFRKYERVFYTNANNLVGWTDGTAADIDGGIVGGKIVSSDNRFIADSYGTGSQWHGPVIKASLPEVIQDFRMSAYVGFINKSRADMVGRIEIYLLDVNGQAVCKMALKDTSTARAQVFAEMRAGDRDNNDFIINQYGSSPGTWNNFSGRLQISREGNIWSAWIGALENGVYVKRRIVSKWEDYDNKHNRSVSQVVIHIGAVGTYNPTHERTGVSSIIIEKINQKPEGIPYIAEPGDVLIFDHKEDELYVNGFPQKTDKDFGGRYFKLHKGDNQLIVYPEDTFDVVCRYRERFL